MCPGHASQRHSGIARPQSGNRTQIRGLYGASRFARRSGLALVSGTGLQLCGDCQRLCIVSAYSLRASRLRYKFLLSLQGRMASGSDMRCGACIAAQSLGGRSGERRRQRRRHWSGASGRYQAVSTVSGAYCENGRWQLQSYGLRRVRQ